MKSMTCKQLGGACDQILTGDSGDDIIKAQDRHLKDIVAGGDTAHQDALVPPGQEGVQGSARSLIRPVTRNGHGRY